MRLGRWNGSERLLGPFPGHAAVETSGNPALVIDRPVGHDFEVLGSMRARRSGIGEGIEYADALERILLHTVDPLGVGNTGRLQNRRGDIDDMMELSAQAPRIFDVVGPRDRHGITRAAKVRRDLFGPLKRRVQCPSPADVVMILGVATVEGIDLFQQPGRLLGMAVVREGCGSPAPIRPATL